MHYLVEVSDTIRFLESHLEHIFEKVDTINAVTDRLDELSIQELLTRVDTLEVKVGRTGNNEHGDSLMGFVVHIEERVIELDSSQKTLLQMINVMLEDFLAALDVVRNEITDLSTRVNLTMARDAKALENFIFNLKQYFKAINTVTEEAKVTSAMMHLFEDAKLCGDPNMLILKKGVAP
ncbi:senescence-specific cysteine protease sag39 [Cucumis melo var. makuwa]|uniref:Senescence-specific cysteine protease sag39 n=1 Tax=Cucumis melo var. makuwa TaxID=1194695 RepID=A0A5A7USK0_CUCMM|nr:senescence-specific cysteine protease sag39 [Cucumis melo var. makuwa]TYK29041.1 senescence-specific cysteine protease sag39 [Cucumis melo var. makuwa]